MVLEEKTPDLLALLIAYVGGNAPVVLVVPRPPTPILPHPTASKATEKKRKKRETIWEGELLGGGNTTDLLTTSI